MSWEEIKKDTYKIHPKRQIITYQLQSANRKALCWVNVAYSNYDYREFCKFCVEIQIELRQNDEITIDYEEFEMQLKLEQFADQKLGYDDIEKYFADRFAETCVALILSIETTDKGFEITLYVDNIENATNALNEMNIDQDRLFDFDFKITEDENWDIIGMMLY